MTIIPLAMPHARVPWTVRTAPLVRTVSQARRPKGDVYWLKENAELLNIFECTATPLPEPAIYAPLYKQLPDKLLFFPQYYRFWLSICLDLEDLGLGGTQGERLCAQAHAQDLAGAELSDLQRAEAARLLARRNVGPHDPGLADRLRAFAGRPATFGLPNRKAAYELTHIVFYLSEYGRTAPDLPEAALTSLDYAGLLAFLGRDMDLLAEICIALRFAGQTPSPIWEQAVLNTLAGFTVTAGAGLSVQDDYHQYMVCQWLACLAAPDMRTAPLPDGVITFAPAPRGPGALQQLSQLLCDLAGARSADWDKMRPLVLSDLAEPDLLADAEASTDNFAPFFEVFARAALH